MIQIAQHNGNIITQLEGDDICKRQMVLDRIKGGCVVVFEHLLRKIGTVGRDNSRIAVAAKDLVEGELGLRLKGLEDYRVF